MTNEEKPMSKEQLDEYLEQLSPAEANQFLLGRAVDFMLTGALSKAISCLARGLIESRSEMAHTAALNGLDAAVIAEGFDGRLNALQEMRKQVKEQEDAARAQMAGADPAAGERVSEGGIITATSVNPG